MADFIQVLNEILRISTRLAIAKNMCAGQRLILAECACYVPFNHSRCSKHTVLHSSQFVIITHNIFLVQRIFAFHEMPSLFLTVWRNLRLITRINLIWISTIFMQTSFSFIANLIFMLWMDIRTITIPLKNIFLYLFFHIAGGWKNQRIKRTWKRSCFLPEQRNANVIQSI